jgi:hypothetical protein
VSHFFLKLLFFDKNMGRKKKQPPQEPTDKIQLSTQKCAQQSAAAVSALQKGKKKPMAAQVTVPSPPSGQ